jgi:hypothetical protein
LTPDANNRATTKDILRHDWLAHGPVLSLRLNSTATTSSSLSLTEQQSHKDYEKVHLRTTPTTPLNDTSLSPTNSLVELELHTSAFFDTARLRNHHSSINKEQQKRNRASAIPDSKRYSTSHNSSSHPTQRRPLSLSLDDQYLHSPIDYHFASTSEKTSQPSPSSAPTPTQTYTRRSRRTVSPTSTKTTSTYGNHDRTHSPQTNQRYTLASSPETTRRTTTSTTSPINPSRYLVSYDFDTTLRDLKRKPIYKYIPPMNPPASELNVVPSLLNSTTPVAPSVFTTSAIKFAPAPTRRMSPFKDQETNINNSSLNTARLLNHTISNPSSNIDDNIHLAPTNHINRRSFLTSYDSPNNNIRKSRLLDDNNNLISLKVHD